MRRLLFILIGLFMVYFGIQILFVYLGKGHDVDYYIKYKDGEATVKEQFFANAKNARDSYYISIDVDGDNFNFQIFDGFGKSSNIVKDIEYYKGSDISCLLPIFRDGKILFDVMCKKNGVIFPYNVLNDDSVNDFINSLSERGYQKDNYIDKKDNIKTDEPLTVYVDNLVKKHYIGVNNYKGLYKIKGNGQILKNDIFVKDVYQQAVNGYTKDAYVVADYYAVNNFSKVFFANLSKEGYSFITTSHIISFNSYIQGYVDDSIYIFDRDSKKQYEVNTKVSNILEVGNQDTGIKFFDNGKWSRVEATMAYNGKLLFGDRYENDYINNDYDKIVKYGNTNGYYYLYKKVGNKYKAYRADIYNKDYLTYLFDTTDYNKVIYFDDYVYYIDGNEVKYYSDKTGNRTVLYNKEFQFNKTLIFGVSESVK